MERSIFVCIETFIFETRSKPIMTDIHTMFNLPLWDTPTTGVAQERTETKQHAYDTKYDVMQHLHIAVHIDMYTLLELRLHFSGQNIHGNSVELLVLTESSLFLDKCTTHCIIFVNVSMRICRCGSHGDENICPTITGDHS